MDVEKEILKGYVETILLSLLYKKTYYRYEMQKEIKRLCNGKVEFKEAAVYIALKDWRKTDSHLLHGMIRPPETEENNMV
ncbi:helix-turn-helix transcriptional regulator [Paenibacillus larvae]|nr:hypothetical protein [Paenibacillus larvae]MDT2235698.1 helix-turn-helix transcriptional regulator [Paenibacillus larvae]